jgi:two-component system response regulator YesN
MYALKFSESGYTVDVAQSAGDALSKIEADPTFEVILLDMIMPAMTGTELIKEIKIRFPKMQAQCIVLSNQGQQEDINEAMAAGAVGYIVKAESVPSDVVKKVEALSKK